MSDTNDTPTGSRSWNEGVQGEEVPILINTDAPVLRTQAGPGTGKTFGLVRRVERLLHPDGVNASGSDVLVVAFNRVIARELRNDVENRLVEIGIDKTPVISTVHALCLQVLGEDLRLLLPHEREAMLYDVLSLYPDLHSQYGPRAYDSIAQALHDHEARHAEHPRLWMAVNQWLDRHGATLISDLPARLLSHLESGDFGDRRYKYVVVDEFQDLNPAEQELFFRLRTTDGQFLGLGDSRQSIYRFRGNDREGLRSLDRWAEELGLSVTDIPMRGCQRCPREIVEAANQLMSLSDEESMIATRDDSADIHVIHWDTPEAEAGGMAEKIVANLRNTPQGHRHLVMATRRQFGAMLRDKIHEMDPEIRVDLGFEEGLLDTWPVREAFIFLTVLVDPDAPSWRGWFAYRNPEGEQSYKAPERNSGAYLRFLDSVNDVITDMAVRSLAAEEQAAARGKGGAVLWDRASRYVELADVFGEWFNKSAEEVIREMLAEDAWRIDESNEAARARIDLGLLREKALEVLDEVREGGIHGTRGELKEVARRLRHKIAIREPFLPDETADIQITTLWGAKGVTADHVYVLGLCDEAIPGERREEYPGTDSEFIEEQRRLFYVSLTRAKKTLVLSRPRRVRYSDGKRLGLRIRGGRWWVSLLATRFLRDIGTYLPSGKDGAEWDEWA